VHGMIERSERMGSGNGGRRTLVKRPSRIRRDLIHYDRQVNYSRFGGEYVRMRGYVTRVDHGSLLPRDQRVKTKSDTWFLSVA